MDNKIEQNYCFDGSTPIIYRTSTDSDVITECIYDAYQKYAEKEIYVCTYSFDDTARTAHIHWAKAKFCSTDSIQVVNVYLVPTEIAGGEEWEHIIRVTPNHVFPVLTSEGMEDKDAYLLQTGDKLFSELNRKDIEYVSPVDDAEITDEVDIDFILEENSEHYMEIRRIAKVTTEEITADTSYFGCKFYGITITDPDAPRYFVLANNLISHDSSPRI